jgi:hypothetical protein
MPISPFLGLNSRDATSPELLRFINAVPSSVGVTIHGAVNDTDASVGVRVARGYPAVVKFGGSRTFLATVGTAIYRSTDGGATWTAVKTFSAGQLDPSYTVAKSGLFVLHVNGVATAVVVTKPFGSSSWFAHTSTDGVTWTTSSAFVGPNIFWYNPTDSVVWDGKLVTIWHDTNGAQGCVSTIYDPSTGTMSFATFANYPSDQLQIGTPLCVFNNRLFAIARGGQANDCNLRELVAGIWLNVTTISTTQNFLSDDSKMALFVDGAFMYGFILQTSGSTGWNCFQWDSSLTQTNITAAVIPTALASGLGTAQRMSVIVDDRGTPGSAPTIWLYQSVDGTGASALNEWQWNGPTSYIGTLPGNAGSGPNSTGGDALMNLPFVKHAQGTTYWTSGEDFIQLAGFAPVQGGVAASFYLFSDGTTIAFDSDGASLPQGTIYVPSTTGFPTSGNLYVQTSAGRQTVAYTGITNFATTVAAGSDGVDISTFVGAQTLNVVDTTGFPASGTVAVITVGGLRFVSYTGKTGTSFTNCTAVGAVLSGTLYTGGAVTAGSFTGCTGGTGSMSLGGNVTQAVTGNVRAWQGTAAQAYPLTAATLTGTQVNLPEDNFTVHSVTWQAQTDGFVAGDQAKFVMEKY